MPTQEQLERALVLARRENDPAAVNEIHGMLRKKLFDPARDMSRGQRVLANVGAGMDSLVQGTKQLFGQASTEEIRDKGRLDRDLAESTTGGGLLQAAGTAAVAAPTVFIPGANTVGGAALIGGGMGALSPTESDNVIGGKLANAGIGAASGALLQKGMQAASARLPGWLTAVDEWLAARGLRPNGDPVRQRIAEKALAESLGDPDAARIALMTYNSKVPGMQPTVGAVLKDQDLLAMERRLMERGGDLGNMLRRGETANNAAAYRFAEQSLSGDVGAARQAAADFAEQAKSAMVPRTRGVKVVFEDMSRPVSRLFELEQKNVSPTIRNELAGLRKQIEEAWQLARDNPQQGVQAFHQVRMTGIDDTLSRIANSDTKTSGLLRRQLMEVKNTMDDALDAGLTGQNTWRRFLDGYSSRAQHADQLEAGGELLGRIRSAAPTFADDPSMPSSLRILRTIEEQGGTTNRFGRPTYTPDAENAIGALREELGNMRRAYSVGVGPKGSATAENMAAPANRVIANAERATARADKFSAGEAGTSLAGIVTGNTPLAAAGIGKHYVLDPLHAKAANDIAKRLISLYASPDEAFRTLNRLSMPANVKEAAALRIAQYFAGPAGAIAGQGALSYAQ